MADVDEASSVTGVDTSEDEAVVESLVAGRQKRSTAGQNMSSLLDAAADDDLALLFAEDENDDEFDEDEGADGDFDDMRLDSSSEDEDDQGPNAADDLEGERELERQARADRRKRKAQESLRLTALRKKVKIDSPMVASNMPTTTTTETTPRPKKKHDRVSWLPTPEEGPVRSSSRRQTMQNKELTHARLKDSEQRRIKLIATMEQAAKRKQRMKPKVMTQEERLAEAAKIERLNSKSLNRWEEMEKRKAEERKAKLEALQNRRLEGPVMSWWSGIATWVNGKLVRVGNVEVKPKVEKEEAERKKKTAVAKNAAAQEIPKIETNAAVVPPTASNDASLPSAEALLGQDFTVPTNGSVENVAKQDGTVPSALKGEQTTSSLGFLDGIHQYASLSTAPAPETTTEAEAKAPESGNSKPDSADDASGKQQPKNEGGKTEAASHDISPVDRPSSDATTEAPPAESSKGVSEENSQSDSNPADVGPGETQASHDVSQVVSNETRSEAMQAETEAVTRESTDESGANGVDNVDSKAVPAVPATEQEAKQTETPVQAAAMETSDMMDVDKPVSIAEPSLAGEAEAPVTVPEPPTRPEDIEQTGRNLLVLENFDNPTMQSREYSIYFNSKRPPRLTKISSHLCPITSQLSRYRDPSTGLPYATMVGYREIRNLTEQKYTWSAMLGCYVGNANVAAKGVPEQFITGVKPSPPGSDDKGKGRSMEGGI